MASGRLGIHVLKSPTALSLEWAKSCSCVKQMDGTGALQAAQGGAIRVFRKYFGSQPWTSDPHNQGRNIANQVIGALGGYRHSNLYIEAYNEPPQKMGNDLTASLRFHQGFTEVAHAQGIKVAGYSFATGNPEVNEAQYLAANNWGGVDAISWHAYWGNSGFTQWHALRYRMIRNAGVRTPPVIITETGRDNIEGGGRGWKASGVTWEKYWKELQDYANQINDTMGCTVFTGSPSSDWDAFNCDGFAPLVSGRGSYAGDTGGGGGGSGGGGGTSNPPANGNIVVAGHELSKTDMAAIALFILMIA